VPGSAFIVDENAMSSYVRASFSTATPELMEEAIKRFAHLLMEERKRLGLQQ